MKNIGDRMRARRVEKNLSAREVALRLKVSTSTYRDWESGRKIQGEPYYLISQVLEIPLMELLGVNNHDEKVISEALNAIEEHVRVLRRYIQSAG